VRAVLAAKPDLVFLASYPADTVGLVRSINELGFNARLIGGGPVGLQYAAIKSQLGPLMNNLLGYELYTPASTVKFPGIEQFIAEYQKNAAREGVDPLGYYVPPFIYAGMQVLEQAVQAAGSIDQGKLATVMHERTFNTIVGDIKFAANGEWEKPRVLMVQYKDIKDNDVDQFRSPSVYGVLYPQEFKTADPVVPFR
jgi:branched-chain amino acid transport system substrate-binding protein